MTFNNYYTGSNPIGLISGGKKIFFPFKLPEGKQILIYP